MAITYVTAVKNSRLQVVADAINAGASGAGTLVIRDGSNVELARIDLDNPCGTPSGGVLTMSGLPNSTTAIASGTAANAILQDSAGNNVATGLTVGTVGTDVILDSTSITAGQTVTLNSATITHG